MSYTIAMTDEADNDLADAWMSAPDPPAVSNAMNDAERILSLNPLGSSESLSEGLRRLKVVPILIYFRVDLPRRIVEISNIRLIVSDSP
jgi:hypothetical protein